MPSLKAKKFRKLSQEKVLLELGCRLANSIGRGYCWPTSFKVLGVLFLGEVYSAFLPSKKACWAHQFRYLGVGQQYPDDFCMPFQSRCIRKLAGLPDHLVRLEEKGRGDRETQGLGGLEVDDQLELRGLLHGEVCRLGTFEDLSR